MAVSIPKDMGASKRADNPAREDIKAYTDGSVYNGGVGAAVVLIRQGRPERILHLRVGSQSEPTVYKAELTGFLLDAISLKQKRHGVGHAT
jgi:hypothetical protein